MRSTRESAYPLGLGSNGKKPQSDHQNGLLKINKIFPGTSSAGSDQHHVQHSDLDTINL